MTCASTHPEAFDGTLPPFQRELPGAVLAFGGFTVYGWRVFARAAAASKPIDTWRDVVAAAMALVGSGPFQSGEPRMEHFERILAWRGLSLDAPVWGADRPEVGR